MSEKILLVGAGPIAQEYANILKALHVPFVVIGRGKESVEKFFADTGFQAEIGGIEPWLKKNNPPAKAIIAVGEKELGEITRLLIQGGAKEILVEKPGGFNADDIRHVGKLSNEKKTKVYIAYNRRFYSSVKKAKEIINENGGVLSFHFEFTEWIHKIPETKKTTGIIREWFLANSTHVIDLAFFLGGKPKNLSSYALAGLPWHNGSSIFSGAGITEKKALFSYHANWESAGRWSVEILTAKNRLYLRPLEKLSIQNIGEIDITNVAIDDTIDKKFKPGYYLQVKSFLEDKKNLPDIQEQIHMLAWYEKINQA